MDDKYEFSVKLGGNTQELILQNYEKEIVWEDEIEFPTIETSKAFTIINNVLNTMASGKDRFRIKVRSPHVVDNSLQCDILNIYITRDVKGYYYRVDEEYTCDALTYKQVISEIKCTIYNNDIVGIFTKDLRNKKSNEVELK